MTSLTNFRENQEADSLFSLILQPVRINKPGAPLLGLAKSIYYFRMTGIYPSFMVEISQNIKESTSYERSSGTSYFFFKSNFVFLC